MVKLLTSQHTPMVAVSYRYEAHIGYVFFHCFQVTFEMMYDTLCGSGDRGFWSTV